jgi:hypothetical protein
MRSVVSVTENSTTITDFVPNLQAGIVYAGTFPNSRYFLPGLQNITVVANVGLTATPPNVLLATRELVRLWWQVGRLANRPGTAEQDGPGEVPMGLRKRVSELLVPTFDVGGFA